MQRAPHRVEAVSLVMGFLLPGHTQWVCHILTCTDRAHLTDVCRVTGIHFFFPLPMTPARIPAAQQTESEIHSMRATRIQILQFRGILAHYI